MYDIFNISVSDEKYIILEMYLVTKCFQTIFLKRINNIYIKSCRMI